ncbi:DNA topoisomerase IV subunit A [Candidatus Woesearchaeota archaeon]|nr:DNA topoisomerase IV subunit A [Candidatus Woesearchaeota archaeon]
MSKKKDNKINVLQQIKNSATNIYKTILGKKQPELTTPIRSLSNVSYDPKSGYFELLGQTKSRTLTASTVKTFAQTMKMMNLSKELINTDDIATKREAYYVSKNWGDAMFKEQPESDTVMDDIEAMFTVNREQLGFIPEEKGGDVAGKLTVIDTDTETGIEIKIDCTKFGSGAYSIPSSVEDLKFETNAKFILAIETAGMHQRLVKHKYWKKANCILISLGGVPTRACRRFIRRLSDDMKLPVYAFTDGDPYGWLNIYRTLKVGSGNAAHINKYFCVPNAKFFGITAKDITDYKLPTHPLKDIDIKRVKDGIKNDPFVKHYKEWQKCLQEIIKLKKRAEQQALAQHGLNFVITDYLPEKLDNPKSWLP